MYYTKVPAGRERIEIRKYSSAFLPSYLSAESQNTANPGYRDTRKFVIPGYIFSIRKEGNAVPVPDNEWRIIETLSDPHPSIIDEQGKIISGPLVGIENLIKRTENNSVQIQAYLLGEERTYWIRVRNIEEKEEEEKESRPEKKPAAKRRRKETAEMEITQEQIDQILADAETNGVHATSRSAGVPWQTILRWAREAGKQIPSHKKEPARKRAKTIEPETFRQSTANSGRSPGEIENTVLKERISQLEKEIQRLQKAITKLM